MNFLKTGVFGVPLDGKKRNIAKPPQKEKTLTAAERLAKQAATARKGIDSSILAHYRGGNDSENQENRINKTTT